MLESAGLKHVRLHDARHTCATLIHLQGVPISVIAVWLGQASAALTLSVYAHSKEEALMEEQAASSSAVSSAPNRAPSAATYARSVNPLWSAGPDASTWIRRRVRPSMKSSYFEL